MTGQDKVDETEKTEFEDNEGAVLFCPTCCSVEDAENWGHNKIECGNCGTRFTVELERAKVEEYSLHG
jgi:transcription elongation factor Elf1